MPYKLSAATLAAIAVSCAGAHAAAPEPSIYSFSGFGSFGAVHSSEAKADYVLNSFQPNGPGYTRDWSTDIDSRIAGQLTANFNSQWSAVAQVVVERQWDNAYGPALEWANVQYAPTPEFSIRVGRIALPTLLTSNSQKVGYTLPWVREPVALYGVLPISYSDGVDASYSFRMGQLKNTVLLHAGKKSLTFGTKSLSGTRANLSRMWGVVDVLNYGAATVQISQISTQFDMKRVPKTPLKLSAIGAVYDPGNWFLTGEMGKSKFLFSGTVLNWYAGGGYRVNEVTPYLRYSKRKALGQNFSGALDENTSVAGVRWDFMKNTDVKLQYDRNSLKGNSVGNLSNLQPGFQPGGTYHVVSAIVDVVF